MQIVMTEKKDRAFASTTISAYEPGQCQCTNCQPIKCDPGYDFVDCSKCANSFAENECRWACAPKTSAYTQYELVKVADSAHLPAV